MADAHRPPASPLIRTLLAEAHRFSFFQAVNLIERERSSAARVGGSGPASREVIRFRPDVSMAFAAASLSSVELMERPGAEEAGDEVFRITANFLGLYGPQSPLPNHWSEEILREVADDSTVRDFLDIFHHRAYAFFYRAWSKYRFHAQHRAAGDDAFTQRFLSLIGFGAPEIRAGTRLPPVRLLKYAGVLLQRTRPADSLERLLSDWFAGIPVRVVPCCPHWVPLRSTGWNRLGIGPSTLGVDVTLGNRIYDRNTTYKIVVGPVEYETYLRFLPEGEDHETLLALANLFTGRTLRATLEVRLLGAHRPTAALDAADAPRLGWSSWLSSESPADTVVSFSLREAA